MTKRLEASCPGIRAGVWVALAGLVGFAASSVFSSLLHLRRAAFVLAYAVLVGILVAGYVATARTDFATVMRRRWLRGLLGGLVVGLVLIRGVAGQPRSPAPHGIELVIALAWFGIVCGVIDALLLNVLPVLSVFSARPAGAIRRPRQRLAWGVGALAASLAVTALYHVGFAEFRGPALLQPLIGNALITAGYLLTGSPVAAFVAHVIMHGAAVVRGMETTVQLPPHY